MASPNRPFSRVRVLLGSLLIFMSETKFTTGPWHIESRNHILFIVAYREGEKIDIARLCDANDDLGRIASNAQSISKVPELIEELMALCGRAEAMGWLLDGSGPAQDLLSAKSVLAKARGEQ